MKKSCLEKRAKSSDSYDKKRVVDEYLKKRGHVP
jgi:hypothetical protein